MTRHSRYLEEKMARDNSYCNVQVVFVDVVSYSLRRSYAQLGVINALMGCIETTLSETARQYVDYTTGVDAHIRRDVIVLPSGDGAAIGFPFDGVPDMHLFFTRELWRTVDVANRRSNCGKFSTRGWCDCHDAFLLRGGLSEGRLILYKDLNGNFNLAGDTVNMAARVMGLAAAGQVFLTSDACHRLLDMVPGLEERFHLYPQVRIKHDLCVDVYQYVAGDVSGLDVSTKEARGYEQVAGTAAPSAESTAFTSGVHRRATREQPGEGATAPHLPQSGVVVACQDRMAHVPAGGFSLGGEEGERRLVEVPRPFLIGAYLVTQQDYLYVTGHNPSRFKGPQLPVETVTWIDAASFCNKLSELSGLECVYEVTESDVTADFTKHGYRLPTEAEWQYACLGGSEGDRYGQVNDVAWYSANSDGKTHPVGEKEPNRLGLYDMLGNVWEWCHDWYSRRRLAEFDPAGPPTGYERVLRGGSWSDLPLCVTSAYRHRSSPLARRDSYGFRLLLLTPDIS